MILTRPTQNTVQDMLEKANVRELVEFERFCRDNALWDEMKKCYAPDSQVNISWFHGTGHEFVEASSRMETYAPHKIYNTEIWLNGDRAVAVMMTTIQIRTEIDGYPVELQSEAKLLFRVRKSDGLWMIVSFDSIYEKDALVPVLPNSELSIPKDMPANSRKSYACMIYVMEKLGRPVNRELPGIDRPDLVERIYRELEEWLTQ